MTDAEIVTDPSSGAQSCQKCGSPLIAGSRFCAACGTPVSGCPECGSSVPRGARFCPSCGHDLGEPARVDTGADRKDERKLVTVLFCDLVGSTTLAETRDPERVARILAAYAATMRDSLEQWGGTVEKYIGDGIVAAFGVPVVREDDAARALHAGLEMLERLDGLNQQLERDHGVRLALRIGINTGEVLAATAGRLDQQFLAGDTVNVAARLQQAAEPGTINVAVRTADAAADQFRFAVPESIEARGRAAPVTARRLLGVVADSAVRAHSEAPLFGRDADLRSLRSVLADAIDEATPRTALIVGPAGIGKSRLVREFLQSATTATPGLTVLRGRCRATGTGITYWALGEVVRDASDIRLDDAGVVANEKLAQTVDRLFAGDDEAGESRNVLFALAMTAGITVPANPLAGIRPIAVADALGEAWPRFVSALARRGPLVLFIEDLHWADEQLTEMLTKIADRAVGPIVIVATARPEFTDDHSAFATGRDRVALVPLRALTQDDEGRLVHALLEWPDMPASLRTILMERAEGNPFFLEQLVSGLIDAGLLARDEAGWRVDLAAARASMPDSIHAVLAARIDRLSATEKLVLQEASVIGRTFWSGAVAESVEADTTRRSLDALESKGLVQRRLDSTIGGEREYAFKHALVRDVAYGTLPLARRARSHARVGAWLDRVTERGDDGALELVAYQYRAALFGEGADLAWAADPGARAAVRGPAFEALVGAGAAARQRNAKERALELHEAAMELAIGDEERARAFEELGDDHGWSYHGDPSVEAWTKALELRRAAGDGESIARICLKAARHCALYWGGFANRPSGDVVDAFVDEGLAHAVDPFTRAWLLAIRAMASASYLSLGRDDPRRHEDRIAAAEESARIANEIDQPTVAAVAMRSLGGLYLEAGRPDKSLALAEQQLETIDRVTVTRDRLLHTTLIAARIMDIGGDFERALELGRGVHRASQRESAHERMHATYFVMAPLYRLGRWAEMVPFIEEHLAAFDEETVDMNCPFTRGGPAIGALVLEQLGRADRARDAATRIVPNDSQPGVVEAWMAERELLSGRPANARDVAERTIAFRRGPSLEEPPYEWAVLAQALATLADWTALQALLPEARERIGYVAWLGPAIDRAEAAMLAARGDSAGARTCIDRALTAYRRLRMQRELAATRAEQAKLPA